MLGMKKLFAFAWMLMLCVPAMGYKVGDCTSRGDPKKALEWLDIPASDWSWTTKRSFNKPTLCIEVTNKTNRTIYEMHWEGTQSGKMFRLTETVPPNSTHEDCQFITEGAYNVDKRASVTFYTYNFTEGECLRRWTEEDQERTMIYDGCMASKSKGATSVSIPYIRKECRNISRDPSIFDKWRWGS